MNRRNIEEGILSALAALGWILLVFTVPFTVALKGTSNESFYILFVAYSTCIVVTTSYYLFRRKLILSVPIEESSKYIRPYRMGTMLVVGLIVLAIGTGIYAE